ncbi:MAG: acyl-CoA dehydrogenase [Myxococcota bacterium]
MHHYRSHLRDLEFCLFEWLRVQDTVLGQGPFEGIDEASARDALTALEKLARTELAASFVESDRVPLKLDDEGNVALPDGIKKSFDSFYEGGWHLFEAPSHADGFNAPPSVGWAGSEMVVGSNPVVGLYSFGALVARVIDRVGTDAQRSRFVRPILENRWGGTMMLSEPQAGSDVGEGTTRARPLEDGTWALEGTKCWITNGDFDAVDNIVHLVLARPEGAGPGTKGLSLFIVPKFWVEEDGRPGERNGVFVTSIEDKMGIKGSATCVMNLGENRPCRGFLAGEVHDGIRQMFQVIEQARMFVGVKSMATLSTAYLNALEYAKERVQGPDLAKAADKTSPRVRIIEHPDVRRALMTLKAHAEGMRALVFYAAHTQDRVELKGGHGHSEAKEDDRLNDLLLPLIKGYCSEKAAELLPVALQVFGGSGYVKDHPMEQYIRDQKIDTLYEGTTHIQALDLIFRKVMRDGGATLRTLLGHAGKVAAEAPEEEGKPLTQALGQLQQIFAALAEKATESVYHVGFQGNRVLFAVAETVIGCLLVEQAAVARAALQQTSGDEAKDFYLGKLAAARFWCLEVLPNVRLCLKHVESSRVELMELPETAF